MIQYRDQLIDTLLGELGKMAFATRECLTALTSESKLRSGLLLAEVAEAGQRAEQAEQEAAKANGAVGMMGAPYGYCATCGTTNAKRERATANLLTDAPGAPDSLTDICPNGHRHSAGDSLLRPPKPDPPPIEVVRNDQTTVPDSEI